MNPVTLKLDHLVEPAGRREQPVLRVAALANGLLEVAVCVPGDRTVSVGVVDPAVFADWAARAGRLAGDVSLVNWESVRAFVAPSRNGEGR